MTDKTFTLQGRRIEVGDGVLVAPTARSPSDLDMALAFATRVRCCGSRPKRTHGDMASRHPARVPDAWATRSAGSRPAPLPTSWRLMTISGDRHPGSGGSLAQRGTKLTPGASVRRISTVVRTKGVRCRRDSPLAGRAVRADRRTPSEESASLPGSIEPIRSPTPNIRAGLIVHRRPGPRHRACRWRQHCRRLAQLAGAMGDAAARLEDDGDAGGTEAGRHFPGSRRAGQSSGGDWRASNDRHPARRSRRRPASLRRRRRG